MNRRTKSRTTKHKSIGKLSMLKPVLETMETGKSQLDHTV